ncbi:ribosomal protein S18 acetylase RimI-like enzyme [Rhodothalassium salexigens DSM 2132]|uniref:Ribosomal protein S18 acetylase RimI-like enzyme n=1 Tax=Rhodothalassium salexigens DSM 2132 TaxID=1188247 RepID=A0A4R2PQ84_RHOSA|nr:GNAT family N-acetyltransferase [Rhodothalassium salexigens]MBB4210484.1 RimJ/RimL family protein N-acetyltransferase [Rhodothalassium salexigens DSM 2132]MBK1639448.1 hypothetical protein [Rhodothalassium salexigens DSM 2132]TCP37959.1 ribosomal protein S18 acetylase RimI-like enzyme [Rhodothalassium salexigens DSM 2132]
MSAAAPTPGADDANPAAGIDPQTGHQTSPGAPPAAAPDAGSCGPVEVVRLGVDDVAVFRALRLAAMTRSPDAFNSTYGEELAKPDAWYAERLAEDGVFAAGGRTQPQGMVGVRRYPTAKARHKAWLYGLFVAPEARGRGVGQALVQAALSHAAGEVDVELVLLTVVTGNAPAIALYERMGFEAYGVEPRAMKTPDGTYYDDLLMARPVP